MRTASRFALLAAAVAVVAAPAHAGAPLHGVYTSLGGQVLQGRFAESFPGPGQYLTAGNVLNVESWDGSALGTQWKVSCAELVTIQLIFDGRDQNGTGIAKWKKSFSGGRFLLHGTGEPWDGGDANYTGDIDTYDETVSVIFVNGNRISANSDVAVTGSFDLYPSSCIGWSANGADLMGSKPAGYPDYLDTDCVSPRTDGRFGTRTDFTLTIGPCAVPTDDSTWGRIKSLYE